jgi:transcriptional regulator with XRE-family HTH domain
MQVAQVVRSRREHRKLSLRKFGTLVGVTAQSIAAIEAGRNPIPRKRIGKFARCMCMSKKSLIEVIVSDFRACLWNPKPSKRSKRAKRK